jgi:hypothetical protein
VKSLIAYFWPFITYRDVERGSLMERAAAWRHNRRLSVTLPLYINRWAVCAALALVLINTVPTVLVPVVAVLLTITVCGLLHLVRLWLMFRRKRY